MNIKKAAETLNHFGKEKQNADNNNMDWVPNRQTRRELAEARSVLSVSRNPDRYLTAGGSELFYSEAR